jgi:hypothetical protein
LIFYDNVFLLNTQCAYIASSLVVYATYKSYYKNIITNSNLYAQAINIDEEIDEIEDTRGLRLKSIGSYFSFYRIFGYLVLIFSVIYLIKYNLFNAIGYMVGVSLMPFSIILYYLYLFIKSKLGK